MTTKTTNRLHIIGITLLLAVIIAAAVISRLDDQAPVVVPPVTVAASPTPTAFPTLSPCYPWCDETDRFCAHNPNHSRCREWCKTRDCKE